MIRCQHIAEPLNIQKPRCCILPRCLQQDMVGLVAAQNVIDQIGRDRHLTSGFFLAGMAPLDQPGNDSAIAEGAFEQPAFLQPGFQIIAQHVLVEQVERA